MGQFLMVRQFGTLHYRALLERKAGGIDYAAI
jgi:hypothetical protein